MARSHLTLAALATSAVAGLDLSHSALHTAGGDGSFDSARLRAADGRELIIRVPTSQQAETEQGADLIALRSLSHGIRSRLPFDAPAYIGQTPLDGTRAVVFAFVSGHPLDAAALGHDEALDDSVGRAIAAIHSLPTSFVSEAGLPVLGADELRADAKRIVSRASETRLLPTAVRERWQAAIDDHALWQFQPTVIHGALAADRILIARDGDRPHVSGVIEWGSLRVGDPALDLHWIASLGEIGERTLAVYASACSRNPDSLVTVRARLYAELEIARWLLHGHDIHDSEIVDDAVSMLDGLVDNVLGDVSDPLSGVTGPVLGVGEVETMLDQTPIASSSAGIAMQTDTYDRSELERALGKDDSRSGRSPFDDDDSDEQNRTGARGSDAEATGQFDLWGTSEDASDATKPIDPTQSARSSSSE
ncbi:phosphotransferase [Plantibacter sp. YIM 135249]|uniref:phosphotransferase n=1 Tax=Plantibacter sp. YIM 135249 TaxID=3423918 RepID=UPI003D33C7B7